MGDPRFASKASTGAWTQDRHRLGGKRAAKTDMMGRMDKGASAIATAEGKDPQP